MSFVLPLIGGLGTAARLAIGIGATVGLNALARRRQKKQAARQRTASATALIRSTIGPAIAVYGETAVGAVITYANVRKLTYDSDLYILASHCMGPIESIGDVYYEDTKITPAQRNAAGRVTSGKYGRANTESLVVNSQLGETDQASNPTLLANFSHDWTSAHRGRGIANTVWRMRLHKTTADLYQGAPSNLRAVVKGLHLYDPRQDSTNGGSGAHRLADSDTWEWSDNPILAIADYCIRFGVFISSRIDWPTVRAQADICDASVPIPGGTEKRYRCDCAIDLAATHRDNLNALTGSCMGRLVKSARKWRILAGAYDTSSVAIGTNDIVGPVKLQTARSKSERYNAIDGYYLSRANDYREIDVPARTDPTLRARDGGSTITRSQSLQAITRGTQAQRVLEKRLQLDNEKDTIEIPLRWSGLKLTPQTRISLTYPRFNYTSKIFRVLNLTIDSKSDSPIYALCQSESSSTWADLAANQYHTESAGIITRADDAPASPSALTATAGVLSIHWEWDPPEEDVDYFRLYTSADSSWSNAALLFEGLTTSTTEIATAGQTRYGWIRSVRKGLESDRLPDSDTSSITATAAAAPPGGDAGTGYDPIFAVTDSPSTTPSAPSNSWGYREPLSPWFTAAPTLTETDNTLWQNQRQLVGTPAQGAAVSANFEGSHIIGRFGVDGEDGQDALTGQTNILDFTDFRSSPGTNGANIDVIGEWWLSGGTGSAWPSNLANSLGLYLRVSAENRALLGRIRGLISIVKDADNWGEYRARQVAAGSTLVSISNMDLWRSAGSPSFANADDMTLNFTPAAEAGIPGFSHSIIFTNYEPHPRTSASITNPDNIDADGDWSFNLGAIIGSGVNRDWPSVFTPDRNRFNSGDGFYLYATGDDLALLERIQVGGSVTIVISPTRWAEYRVDTVVEETDNVIGLHDLTLLNSVGTFTGTSGAEMTLNFTPGPLAPDPPIGVNYVRQGIATAVGGWEDEYNSNRIIEALAIPTGYTGQAPPSGRAFRVTNDYDPDVDNADDILIRELPANEDVPLGGEISITGYFAFSGTSDSNFTTASIRQIQVAMQSFDSNGVGIQGSIESLGGQTGVLDAKHWYKFAGVVSTLHTPTASAVPRVYFRSEFTTDATRDQYVYFADMFIKDALV